MKNLNFWRSLFFAALAVVGFSACSDDDDDNGNSGEASLTVNGGSSAIIGVTGEAGETEAVEVVSANSWTLAFEEPQEWCEPSVTSGKGGTTQLKFTVTALPEGEQERSAVAVLSSQGMIVGVSYTVTAKITIQQTPGGEVVTPVLIYKETFGTAQVSSNTNVDSYTGWDTSGEGSADVTYAGTNTSIRNTSPNNSSSYTGASGAPVLFFGATPATFTVQNITLTAEQTRLQLTFGGQQTITYGSDYTWSNENLLVALSADGTTWSTIEYTTSDGDQNRDGNNWALATADVTLKAPTTKLFIRFTSPLLASNVRIDDIILQTGAGGQVVDLEAGDPISTVTISEITAVGDYKVENATVVAAYASGFVMKDATGAMLVFLNAAPEVAVGDVVSVKGTVASYGGALQFGAGAVVEKTGTAEVPTATPVSITADNIGGYMTNPVVTFIKMTGTLVKSSNYYNVQFPFETNYTGSLSSPNADLNVDTYVGNLVDIEGWFVNNGNASGTGTYFTVVATSVANNTETPALNFTTTPTNFAATSPEAQTISFTAQNIPADQVVNFAFTGTNADKFQVDAQSNNSVTISAVGDNDSDAAYTATLVATYNGTELDKLDVRQDVKLADGAVEAVFDYTAISEVNTTVDGVTIACDKGGSTSSPACNTSSKELRIYRYNTFTFSVPEGKTIIDIKFTFSGTGYMGYQLSADSGTYVGDSTTVSGEWTGDAQTVQFTNNGDADNNVQARFKKIVVTYK